MSARILQGTAPGGARMKLADALPLATPLVVQFFPVYACNFRCKYCVFSVKKKDRGFISDEINMSFDLYKKCIDELAEFPDKLKTLRFVGMGEPLMHKDIARMVDYAKKAEVAHCIEILTNASLLTRQMSDELIASGLSRLSVSLQGISSEKYAEISATKINFNELVNNIRYFYSQKRNTEVYVKVIDLALESREEELRFYDIFKDICDIMSVEYTGPIYPAVDYDKVLGQARSAVTQFGLSVFEPTICPQPFFTMQINPDGNVVPCYSIVYPEIPGNCKTQTLGEIWNGRTYQLFRRKMLNGYKTVCQTCTDCQIFKHRLFKEDDLSNDAERLKPFYEKLKGNRHL